MRVLLIAFGVCALLVISVLLFRQEDKQFVSEDAYRKNLEDQQSRSPHTLAALRKLGVNDETYLKLEYFFYTNAENKAVALSQDLAGMGYSVEHEPAVGDAGTFLVTGWTTKKKMLEATILIWTRQMCQLGFDHDCGFDGWGTYAPQD